MHDDALARQMWRELRSWPLATQIGTGLLAVGSVALAFALPAILGPDRPPKSAWPEERLSEAAGAVEAPEPPGQDGDDLPEGVSAYDGEPLWTQRLDDESGSATQVEQGTLVQVDGSLRLVADGETVWEHTWEDFAPEIGVAGDVVVISGEGEDDIAGDEPWPGRQDTVALDLDTGEERWHDQDASFVTVFSDAVLMSECGGGQDDRIGDCTLYARDPADLSTIWSTPTYASVRVLSSSSWAGEPLPDPLLVESFPTGYESRTVSVLDGDGDELTSVPTHDSVLLSESDRMLVVYDDYDDNPADDCTATLAGYRFGEDDPAWEIEADTRKTADLSSCGALPSTTPRDGRLPLTIDGAPAVVELATGEAEWTAPAEGQAYALGEDGGTLVVGDWEAAEDNLVAYDVASGEELWRASALIGASTQASVAGSTLWIHGSGDMWGWSDSNVLGYRLDTGEGLALPGSVSSFAPGEIIMSDGEYEEVELTAWPVDLWAE